MVRSGAEELGQYFSSELSLRPVESFYQTHHVAIYPVDSAVPSQWLCSGCQLQSFLNGFIFSPNHPPTDFVLHLPSPLLIQTPSFLLFLLQLNVTLSEVEINKGCRGRGIRLVLCSLMPLNRWTVTTVTGRLEPKIYSIQHL